MTPTEFNQLDPDLLTRAIAEVMCGWKLIHPLGSSIWVKEDGLTSTGYNHIKKYPTDDPAFTPLTSIDDAVMVVRKLNLEFNRAWSSELKELLSREGLYVLESNLINCSASLRMNALCLVEPRILVRYNELKERA